jgi:radical SAM superfamily enzyme YgiQ (UPF0313 family)
MRYEGPIYRPPSEADSLLIQATVGCPHNRCTFCMVYKNGSPYRVRTVKEIVADMQTAASFGEKRVRSLFLPAGNTIAMPVEQLAAVCEKARELFPCLERITVYGSSPYILRKGGKGLLRLAQAGLSRIHVGLESGDDQVLKAICKGTDSRGQIRAGKLVLDAGIELSLYVILGIGGRERSRSHALETAAVLNAVNPTFIRLRTFVPKVNTVLLEEVNSGRFGILGPHEALRECRLLIQHLSVTSLLCSDHYTNYINLEGRLPYAAPELLGQIDAALKRPHSDFRPFFIGTQ